MSHGAFSSDSQSQWPIHALGSGFYPLLSAIHCLILLEAVRIKHKQKGFMRVLTSGIPCWIDYSRRLGISKGLVCDIGSGDRGAALKVKMSELEGLVIRLRHGESSMFKHNGTMSHAIYLCRR